jgi:hypothetical protein
VYPLLAHGLTDTTISGSMVTEERSARAIPPRRAASARHCAAGCSGAAPRQRYAPRPGIVFARSSTASLV